MSLLREYAITHDVFDANCYSHEEVGTARIELLKDVFLEEALVRNLRSGEWLSFFYKSDRPWHRRGIELLKKMFNQKRFRIVENVLPATPNNDADWFREALASNEIIPLNGIISTAQVENDIGPNSILGRIDKLGSFPGWTNRCSSVRLRRCRSDYVNNLSLIMNCANSVMFIDPYLDPSKRRYEVVLALLRLAASRKPLPLIEIHRGAFEGSGSNRREIYNFEWENRFRNAWEGELDAAGLKVEVYIWDSFHDRYLITDLIGVHMSNGYDTTLNPNDKTTWSRLSRKDRDDIQREFDVACNRHDLVHHFALP